MSDPSDEIQKLLRLKRYEMPPEGYFENFLEEFHQRQRGELLRQSAHGLFLERLSTYVSGFGARRSLVLAAGGAYALFMTLWVLLPRSDSPVGAGASSNLAASPDGASAGLASGPDLRDEWIEPGPQEIFGGDAYQIVPSSTGWVGPLADPAPERPLLNPFRRLAPSGSSGPFSLEGESMARDF